jgi:hypothetical protein
MRSRHQRSASPLDIAHSVTPLLGKKPQLRITKAQKPDIAINVGPLSKVVKSFQVARPQYLFDVGQTLKLQRIPGISEASL